MRGRLLLVALAAAGGLTACADSSPEPIAAKSSSTTTTTPDADRYREPTFDDVEVTHDLEYGRAPGVDGEPEALLLDLYEPAGDHAVARPAVVWVHGGGYAVGDKRVGPSAEMAQRFAELGYVTASINYRLLVPTGCSGTAESNAECQAAAIEAIHDGQAAVRWLRASADTYGIDTDRLAIGGESAGAITAAGVGVWSDSPGSSGTPDESSEVAAWISISGGLPGGLFVDALDAPGLLFAGTDDGIVPHQWSVDMQVAMEKVDVPVELVSFEGAGHVPWDRRVDIEDATIDFLYEHLDLDAVA